MARPRSQLHEILKGLNGVKDAYFQAPTTGMEYPCIVYEPSPRNDVSFADNIKYLNKKRYQITVIDRNPDSLIPDQVEGLPYTQFDRYFRTAGLHHFVFQLFF